MTTEEIDLKAIKALIEKSHNLKQQVNVLTQQVDKLQVEQTNLSNQLIQKEQTEKQTIEGLKAEHAAVLAQLIQKTKSEKNALNEKHEKALFAVQKASEEKNATLAAEWEQLKQQNHAVMSRIRGLSS